MLPLALPPFAAEPRPLKSNWVLRCSRCKAHRRLDSGTLAPMANLGGSMGPVLMCCGLIMRARILKAVLTEHRCGARCRASKGHVCECSCGGANHGRDA